MRTYPIAFQFITRNFVPRQYSRNAPASLFRKRLIRGHPFMTSTRRGQRVRLQWTQVDGGGGPAPCGRPHRNLKLESTDVILSSSHAKKLASFLPEFRLWTEKK